MAIKNQYIFKGIIADYWKIIETIQDIRNNKTLVTLGLYANNKARLDDVNNILMNLQLTISGVDFTRDELYSEIKKLDAWITSQDA